MFSPTLRLVLMLACLAYAGLIGREDPMRAGVLVATAALLAYGALRMGGVPAAFVALRRNDLASAKRLLEQTPTRFLNADSRAKYQWVEAALAEAAGDLAGAREKLDAALASGGLKRKAEQGVALVTAAALDHRLGESERARERLEEAQRITAAPDVQRMVQKLRAELDAAS